MESKSILKALVLVITLAASAQASAKSTSIKCVDNERDFSKVPAVAKVVKSVGGINNLEGRWKLGGFEGNFANVTVDIRSSTAAGLEAQIKGLDGVPSDFGSISVCNTTSSGTLQIKVVDAGQSLYMQAVSDDTIKLAQIQNGQVGSYHIFQKQ